MSKPTEVFLHVDFITKRKGGISDLSMRWRVAKWIARGTGTVLYTSKQCGAMSAVEAQDMAVALAHKWLVRQNMRPSMSQNVIAAMEWTGPRYVDTTNRYTGK